jgi:hypothetical protein
MSIIPTFRLHLWSFLCVFFIRVFLVGVRAGERAQASGRAIKHTGAHTRVRTPTYTRAHAFGFGFGIKI